ncbi:50S ribosomal protein L7/L12 [Microbispora sp. RL4-1S]|uniref:50S ribosomal protein L7/L12 n=1 Tax=Microbispora oryzae TaxID=2806554 RepID=A0A941AHA4_9ACTN|nr:50S ribosomal protein L7/L12 [Microbispora oryzae]MBP2703871.1 50S ribosomal protein L7/L12 [Microbispora oryzae]
MTVGWTELFVLIVVGVLLICLVGFIAVRAGARPSDPLSWRSPGWVPPISVDVQDRVRELYAANRKVEAIKLLRQETGIGLAQAKSLADAIGSGAPLPMPTGAVHQADLATRARELMAAGRTEQAVFLVRGETGMGQAEAEAFIGAL